MKKLRFPKLALGFSFGPASFVGIDIGTESVKVVQLRQERERAVLETYGELKVARYFQDGGVSGSLLTRSDQAILNLLTDVLRESNVTTRRAVIALPSTASFVIAVNFPRLTPEELKAAVPFEAKKYIPIPASEVALDWQVLEEDEASGRMTVLLAAVPHEVGAKFDRVAKSLSLELEAVEIESFSLVRALIGAGDQSTTAIVNWGAVVTTLTIVERRQIRMNHNFGRGSQEITSALAHSMGISAERAETVKKGVGLSEKPEEREVASIIAPVVDSTLTDLERAMVSYNRMSERKIEKIILAGGGASLGGLVDRVAKRFGLETSLGNPFHRTVFPPFLAPVLREIAPNFAVAVGLALRQIAS